MKLPFNFLNSGSVEGSYHSSIRYLSGKHLDFIIIECFTKVILLFHHGFTPANSKKSVTEIP